MNKISCFVIIVLLVSSIRPIQARETRVWTQHSDNGVFVVALQSKEANYSIGRFHHWVISVKDRDGRPVSNARIGVNGCMPSHGHGMQSQPVVTEYLGAGSYLLEGMKFNMAGSWLIVLGIDDGEFYDGVKFDVDIEY